MKIKRLEHMRESQRTYHRQCQWVMTNGLYVLHLYDETTSDALSWWDDVGFILGDRRVIVWWHHPRQGYADKIEECAWKEAGDVPREGWLFDKSEPVYKRVGRSRKKITSYLRHPAEGELRRYYDRLDVITKRLWHEGIDFEVTPSWHRERLSWATGVGLVAPLEVRNEVELKNVANLALRLLRGEATLDREFPGYRYGKGQWLAECEYDRTLS